MSKPDNVGSVVLTDISGLERYRPAEAKSNRVLGRFPMRNKFVADHIFETTGQRRTPKQVGSRIQQLRDTSSGKHSKCLRHRVGMRLLTLMQS